MLQIIGAYQYARQIEEAGREGRKEGNDSKSSQQGMGLALLTMREEAVSAEGLGEDAHRRVGYCKNVCWRDHHIVDLYHLVQS